jgi:hypothetical protein
MKQRNQKKNRQPTAATEDKSIQVEQVLKETERKELKKEIQTLSNKMTVLDILVSKMRAENAHLREQLANKEKSSTKDSQIDSLNEQLLKALEGENEMLDINIEQEQQLEDKEEEIESLKTQTKN